jgi:hypothetical protein
MTLVASVRLAAALAGVDVETHRQLFGGPVMQQPWALVSPYLQELRTHNGNDAAFLDEAQEIVPGIGVHGGRRRNRRDSAGHACLVL